MPHGRFGVKDLEVEASELRTARWLREQARRVLNSHCPDLVPHSRRGGEVRASASAQEMKTAGEIREQARRVEVPNSGRPNPFPDSRHDIEARASANAQEMKAAAEVRERAQQVVKLSEPNATCPVSSWRRG